MSQIISEIKKRPRLKVPLTRLDVNLEALSVMGILLSAAIVAYYWQRLPAMVPTHFSSSGKVDGWGPKETLYFLPGIIIGTYAALTILCRFPHVFNYPVPITEENAARQYRMALTTIRLLKTGIIWQITVSEWSMIQVALGRAKALTPLSWVLLVGIGVVVVVQVVRAIRLK